MTTMHTVDIIEIRERYNLLRQKTQSLQIAINERRNQMRTIQELSGEVRLRSARVKPPKYVTALQNMLERDMETLRDEFQHGKVKNAYSEKETFHIERLLDELDRRFNDVVHSLYVPADKPEDIENKLKQRIIQDDEPMVVQDPDTNDDESPIESRTSSILPNIRRASIAESITKASSDVFSLPSPSENQSNSAPSEHSSSIPDQPRPEFNRGYSMFLRHPLRSKFEPDFDRQKHSRDNYRRKSNPYKSSFPDVPPLPPQRQRTRLRMQLPHLGGDGSEPHRFTRQKTLLNENKRLREKTWLC